MISNEFQKAFAAYANMRKEMKAPLTLKAKERIMKQLRSYPVCQWISLLEQSTKNKWQNIYPLPETEVRP